MSVAQFWDAGILGDAPISSLDVMLHTQRISYIGTLMGCGDELKRTWAVIYLSNGIYNTPSDDEAV